MHWGVQERHQSRNHRRGRGGALEGLFRDLLPDPFGIVMALDFEVDAEQRYHRKVGSGLPVSDGTGLQGEPTIPAMRMDELPAETGLAPARFADHGDHLALALPRPVESYPELLQFRAPPDERCEAPPGRSLEAG